MCWNVNDLNGMEERSAGEKLWWSSWNANGGDNF
jgi:hypothetical protein